jgi:2,3-bisphosphoglycerate-independent phosphoglycerate mutase
LSVYLRFRLSPEIFTFFSGSVPGAISRLLSRDVDKNKTEKNRQLCGELASIDLPDVDIFVKPVKDYRFLLVLRGKGLSDAVGDTDPQTAGNPIQGPQSLSEEAGRTVQVLEAFLDRAREVLAGHEPANMILLRGFSSLPDWPSMSQVFGLRGVAIARYPMYLGVSRLVGMTAEHGGETLEDQVDLLKTLWNEFDFFFLHVKEIDSAGEDGDFKRKTDLIQKVDPMIPEIMGLEPDVLLVTGDHSTPSVLQSHSWHPVPALLYSPACRPDRVRQFGEKACLAGGLGPRFPATDLLPLALAHAGRLKKFGA